MHGGRVAAQRRRRDGRALQDRVHRRHHSTCSGQRGIESAGGNLSVARAERSSARCNLALHQLDVFRRVHQQNLVLHRGSRCFHGQPPLSLERTDRFHHGVDSCGAFGVTAAWLVPKRGRIVEHAGGRRLCRGRTKSTTKRQQHARCLL